MIDKTQAIKLVKDKLPDDVDVMYDAIVEKDYGWLIYSQSKKYIETGNIEYLIVGIGGTLVEKNTGNCIEFGSSFDEEENLKMYELGYLQSDNMDIIIQNILDMQQTLNYLDSLNISYVIPEEENGTVWKIPKSYTKDQFKKKLRVLPSRFNIGSAYFIWKTLEEIKYHKPFVYELEINTGFENSL